VSLFVLWPVVNIHGESSHVAFVCVQISVLIVVIYKRNVIGKSVHAVNHRVKSLILQMLHSMLHYITQHFNDKYNVWLNTHTHRDNKIYYHHLTLVFLINAHWNRKWFPPIFCEQISFGRILCKTNCQHNNNSCRTISVKSCYNDKLCWCLYRVTVSLFVPWPIVNIYGESSHVAFQCVQILFLVVVIYKSDVIGKCQFTQ